MSRYRVEHDPERELDADIWGATTRTRPFYGCWLVWDTEKGEYTGDMFQHRNEAETQAEYLND